MTARHFETLASLQAALDLDASAPGAFRFLTTFGPATFRCDACDKACALNTSGNGCGTGYARVGPRDTAAESFICYPCAGERERRDLLATGKGALYLIPPKAGERPGWSLTNWTGDLRIPLYAAPSMGSHNFAGRRYDVRFTFGGADWHGVQYGDNTQICHVRRLKPAKRAA